MLFVTLYLGVNLPGRTSIGIQKHLLIQFFHSVIIIWSLPFAITQVSGHRHIIYVSIDIDLNGTIQYREYSSSTLIKYITPHLDICLACPVCLSIHEIYIIFSSSLLTI